MFTKFTVALATYASVGEAYYSSSYYQPQTQYSQYQPSYYGSGSTLASAYSAPQRSSYSQAYPQYAQYGQSSPVSNSYGHYQQPVYSPTYAHAQSSYVVPAPSSYAHAPQPHVQSYAPAPTPEPVQAHPHTHETHEYNEGCDIGGSSQNTIFDYDNTWWTPTEQFSPPLHPFVPFKDIPPIGVYAGCVTTEGEDAEANRVDSGDTILFAQLPGQSTSVRTKEGDFLRGFNGNEYKFVIYEGGQIVNSDGENCDLTIVGDEFNPLAEIENDLENPYADQSRGRISNVFGEGSRSEAISLDQPKVLLNLLGEDSILGRSLFVFEKMINNADVDFRTGANYCCVIARMEPPTTMVSNVTWVQPNEAPHHHHYNSYSQNNYSGY